MSSPDITPVPKELRPTPISPNSAPFLLTPFLRILFVVLGCGLIAGFCLAYFLEPSPQGFGTHQQLGLPPCSIQFLFGIPCPSCGMTTSFAWFVRGRIFESIHANIAATYLAMICLLLIPWLMISSWTGQLMPRRKLEYRALILLSSFLLVSVVQWGVRIGFAS
ncbi:DUF2752 domain-containing protein [Rubinisphaera italica]|nr:DUF2752 domain-containing protein [Rubinisphaera italica]